MMDSMNSSQLEDIARDITRDRVNSIEPVGGGGNNRIYQVSCSRQTYALKFYPSQANDPRDRLGQEYEALEFLSRNGIRQIPIPVRRQRDKSCALYEWVDGERIDEVDKGDVDALASFLMDIQSLRQAEGVERMRPASASCLHLVDACEQLQSRIKRLEETAVESEGLRDFLCRTYRPAVDACIDRFHERCHALGVNPEDSLPRERQVLSPSDFGFHNALRTRDGRIVFMDFEYFGWDDPVKMTLDVAFHPGMNLAEKLAGRFQSRISDFLEDTDDTFGLRLDLLTPVIGLIWCAILLNEFLPESWARREAAGHVDAEASQRRQLDKALLFYQRLNL